MSTKKQIFFRWSTALLIIGILYGTYHMMRGRTIALQSLFPAAGPRLTMSLEGLHIAQSENGIASWQMNAGKADLYDNKEAFLSQVEILYTGPGKSPVRLAGDSGTMDTSSGNATVRGNGGDVRVVTGDGYLLTTRSLNWRAADRVVKTSDPFKLLGPEIYLEGRGLLTRVDMHTMEVQHNVKAVLQE